MNEIKEKTVADLVSENIKTAHVFKKYGIDFCCGGGVSVAKACEKNKVDFSTLEKELLAVETTDSRAYNYITWELGFLVDHIVNVHHTYVLEALPLISQYANKVAKVHGAHYQEVVEINRLFHEVANELNMHMKKEEMILFPYIKDLLAAQKAGTSVPVPGFDSVDNPIRMMQTEHESAGDIFKMIASLSNNYTPPEGACNTFRALYSKLEEFEQDLHLHIHLENNIVFPKASNLEQMVLKN